MAAKKAKAPPPPPTPAEPGSAAKLSKFVAFESAVIHRSQIREADYNPRVIDTLAKKKLRERLKKRGLIEPLVWNRRTGVLVGGHQRLAALDALEESADYLLPVAVTDSDEKEEREDNVALNNPGMQGQWDPRKLGAMLTDGAGASWEAMGFEPLELEAVLEGTDFNITGLFQEPATDPAKAILDDVQRTADAGNAEKAGQRARAKAAEDLTFEQRLLKSEAQKANMAAQQVEDSPLFYIQLVCRNAQEREMIVEFFEMHPTNTYVDASRLFAKLGIERP
jgi:ParB-like chromosome segregation protein Spo0J